MLAIAISAALLYVYVGVFSPGQSKPNRDRILLIALGAFGLELALGAVSESVLWWVLSLLAISAFVCFTVEKALGVQRRPALKIAAAYTATRVVVSAVVLLIYGALGVASA